jgi:NADH:ubiquinone oxidoreductase subunit 6 (subunit J)
MADSDAPDSDEQEVHEATLANRFDIRRLIGAVFVVYGVILTALGIFGSEHVKNKAAGLNIDLWAGLGMLVFAAVMIAWALLRPVQPEPPEQRGRGSGRIRRAPAT